MTSDELWSTWLPIIQAERKIIDASPFRRSLLKERRWIIFGAMEMVLTAIVYVQQNQDGTREQTINEIEETLYYSMMEYSRSTRNENERSANRLSAAVARLAIRKLRQPVA